MRRATPAPSGCRRICRGGHDPGAGCLPARTRRCGWRYKAISAMPLWQAFEGESWIWPHRSRGAARGSPSPLARAPGLG